METAKLFMNGRSQAVRLPMDCRFSGNEVGIKKLGNMVILFSKEEAWNEFMRCGPLTADVEEAILEARKNDKPQERDFTDVFT